jgi:hypothetical protein
VSEALSRITDLPYGQRQRIVVVPDAVLDAAAGSPSEPEPEPPWRPWDLLKADQRHPAIRALQEAEEEGLDLLPVRQSAVGELAMPAGHPLPKTVYIGSPAIAKRYYPMADFHRRVFEERFSEAVVMLMALGADEFRVRSEHGWARDLSTEVDTPVRVAKAGGVMKTAHRKDSSLLFEAHLDPGRPGLHRHPIWFHHEPTWQSIAEGRLEHGLRDFSLSVTTREDFGIDGDLAAKIKRRKILGLGGEFGTHVNTTWILEGTFSPPRRGLRSGRS